MQAHHAVAWLDHTQAKVFHFDRDGVENLKLSTTLPHHQTHNKAGSIDGKRASPDRGYYREIVEAMSSAAEWLIVGPGQAHEELAAQIRSENPELASRIIGVESADHPTDKQIVAHARSFFRAADRMLP